MPAPKDSIRYIEWKNHISKAMAGKDNPMYGKNHTEEARKKIGMRSIGRKTMLGKHHSEEARKKMSKIKIGRRLSNETKKKMSQVRTGEKSCCYKGGKKLAYARARAKRKEFDFIPINKEFEGSQGHHIDMSYVLFIPRWLHNGIKHTQYKKQTMQDINIAAWTWYIFEGMWAQ